MVNPSRISAAIFGLEEVNMRISGIMLCGDVKICLV